MLVEICANSYQSAVNAQEAGTHRIELCTELPLVVSRRHLDLLNRL